MKKIISIILLTLFASCGGSIPSVNESDHSLTNEKAYSKTSNIYFNLPAGWFVAEDNDCNCTDLWIVKNDYSMSITFKKINVDKSILEETKDNELGKIAEFNKVFVKAESGKDFSGFSNEEQFEINGNDFSAYSNRNSKNQSIRTVVFKHYDNYYESDAIQKTGAVSEELFNTQNAVLSSLN